MNWMRPLRYGPKWPQNLARFLERSFRNHKNSKLVINSARIPVNHRTSHRSSCSGIMESAPSLTVTWRGQPPGRAASFQHLKLKRPSTKSLSSLKPSCPRHKP
ncbi:hypothetical protein SLA2020_078740 [Shorea laevis]